MWKPVLITLCLASTTTAAPTAHALADDWLDRAQRDITALPVETPTDLALLQPHELAYELYFTAPTEPRRAFALASIDKMVDDQVEKKESMEQVQLALIAGALDHAQLNDLDGARRYLALSGHPSGAPPSTNPLMPFAITFTNPLRAELDLLTGDRKSFEAVDLNCLGLWITADELRENGHADLADIVLQRMVQTIVSSTATTQPVEGLDRAFAAGYLATAGKVTEARRIAAVADDGPGKDDVHSPGHYSFDAYVHIARAELENGFMLNSSVDRDSALAVLQKYPDPYSQQDRYLQLLNLCASGKELTAFRQITALFRKEYESAPKDSMSGSTYSFAQLAIAAARVGDPDDFRWAIGHAERCIPKPYPDFIDASEEDKRRRAQDQATAELAIAGAYAHTGDIAQVNEWIEKSRKTAQLQDHKWNDPIVEISDAYADRGLFDQALAMPVTQSETDYGTIQNYVAYRLAQAGRFDRAWRLSLQVPMSRRIRLEYNIEILQARAGQFDQLSMQCTAFKTPQERALLELAVGQSILRQTGKRGFRAFLVKES